jgi:hypothetical protein
MMLYCTSTNTPDTVHCRIKASNFVSMTAASKVTAQPKEALEEATIIQLKLKLLQGKQSPQLIIVLLSILTTAQQFLHLACGLNKIH